MPGDDPMRTSTARPTAAGTQATRAPRRAPAPPSVQASAEREGEQQAFGPGQREQAAAATAPASAPVASRGHALEQPQHESMNSAMSDAVEEAPHHRAAQRDQAAREQALALAAERAPDAPASTTAAT